MGATRVWRAARIATDRGIVFVSNGDSDVRKDGPDLSPHPLVTKLHPEPDEHGANATFIGYLGPSSKPDHHRVYLDPSFSAYVEVPAHAIVATTPANSGDDNSPTHVVVKADAPVRHVNVATQTGSASYLAGSIASAYLAAGSTAARGAEPRCGANSAPIRICVALSPPLPSGGCYLRTWPSQCVGVGPCQPFFSLLVTGCDDSYRLHAGRADVAERLICGDLATQGPTMCGPMGCKTIHTLPTCGPVDQNPRPQQPAGPGYGPPPPHCRAFPPTHLTIVL